MADRRGAGREPYDDGPRGNGRRRGGHPGVHPYTESRPYEPYPYTEPYDCTEPEGSTGGDGRPSPETMRLAPMREWSAGPSAASSPASAGTDGASAGSPSADDASSSGATPPRLGGRAERRRAAKRIKRRRRLSATKEVPILIGVALVIAVVLKTFLVQAFVIPSGSMEQTIRIGDRVLVDKFTPWFGSTPERGDVVVFKDPGGWLEDEQDTGEEESSVLAFGKEMLIHVGLLPSDDEQDLIKRVVAVGGDTVECCGEGGRIEVNGKPVDEPYLHPGNKPSEIKFKVTVPIGRVFVMGDHRANSADSRFHLDDPGRGTVPEGDVLGRAIVIAWPFGHWRQLEDGGAFDTVPDAPGAPNSAAGPVDKRVAQLPIPAELPLVIGVVGLYRFPVRRQCSVRSGCAGRGGRCSVRFRRWRAGRRGP